MTGTKNEKTAAAPTLTQDVVNAILETDPKRGRTDVATQLQVPPAMVWAVRGAAGMLKLNDVSKAYCVARLDRAGVSIPTAKPAPKKRAPRAKKVAA